MSDLFVAGIDEFKFFDDSLKDEKESTLSDL